MSLVGAVGIGGTNFHYAVGSPDGDLSSKIYSERTRAMHLAEQIERALEVLTRQADGELDAIAVASKGLIDRSAGRIELMDINDGPTIERFPIVEVIQDAVNLPVYIENDCIAAALAEYHMGAGVDAESLVHVTIGTGIGAGIIDRDHVVRGASNYAGEIGGIRVGPLDGLEWSNIPGAWEAYCSGPGIADYVGERLPIDPPNTALVEALDADDPTPRIFECAVEGDQLARQYLDEIAQLNASGFATIANVFDPELITLGGGVARNHPEYLLDRTRTHLPETLIGEPPRITVTDLDHLGIMGALAQVAHDEGEDREEPKRLAVTDKLSGD